MKALTWHGKRQVRVELFGPFIEKGDILGHEPMGSVEEVGSNASLFGYTKPIGQMTARIARHLRPRVIGVDLVSDHVMLLSAAPHGYDIFQKKEDGAIKVVLRR